MQTISSFFYKPIAILLVLAVTMLSSETFAQGNLKIDDDIGGSGSSTQTDDSNDNSTIYIVGGLVIAGILAYALFFKEKKTDTDTTAALSSPLIYSNISKSNSAVEEFQKVKEQIPVDIFMGIKNDEAVLNNRMYQLGVRVKF